MPIKQSNTPRAIRERTRYHALLNAGVEPKLARKLRGRSNEYIKDFVGVTTPKKEPKLKSYAKETIQKKRREILKYQYAREKGLDIKTALTYKTRSYKFIEDKARYITPYNPPKEIKIQPSPRDNRQESWSGWSKNKDFPDEIKSVAERINLREGFDINASYGYTVVFYAYIEGELDDIDSWLKRIDMDRVTESAIYRTTKQTK